MSNLAVRADGLGKRYRIGAIRKRRMSRATLGEAVMEAVKTPLRNLRQLRGLGSKGGGVDPVTWALRDLSFDLHEGEVLGIIGRNGAGKSTLLKILSRITEPTCGRAEIHGRTGSLLEVGTGFHPDLTGRQNVYLNGAILGMDRRDISGKFDEIVEFAGVAAYIDTPVKRYSSGMQVRLAFAVAAHLEPDIMIVDEVLAVGDAEFQRKCLAKMDDVARGGRTVLFVSHNMNAVQRLCTRCILLDAGRLVADGPTDDVASRYFAQVRERDGARGGAGEWIDLRTAPRSGTGAARFEAVRYISDNPAIDGHAYCGGPVEFTLLVYSDAPRKVGSLAVTLYDQSGTRLVNADIGALGRNVPLQQGRTAVRLRIDALHLRPGVYLVDLWLSEVPEDPIYDVVQSALRLEVVDAERADLTSRAPGLVNCSFGVVSVRHLDAATAVPAASVDS